MVLGSALRMVVIGVIIGLPLAWLASRLIAGMVFGVSADRSDDDRRSDRDLVRRRRRLSRVTRSSSGDT